MGTKKLAICQMADTPQIESTAVMLRHAGYDVRVCGPRLRAALVGAGLDTVLPVESMIALGYDHLEESIVEADLADLLTCDLFVEIKVRNVPKLLDKWPHLKGKIAWWRVNGAQPEICPKGGDEVNLPCPVITACLWYQNIWDGWPVYIETKGATPNKRPHPMAYAFWPPYPRSAEYDQIDRSNLTSFSAPYCMCHSVRAWGYGGIIDECVALGVKMYGNNSPHGQVSHSQVPRIAATSLALVHLKSVDCPGWALYEAILAGCPVITGRMLNSRMLAYDLLKHGQTCYEFGIPASLEYGRGDMALEQCMNDINFALSKLEDPATNYRIGQAGRKRLNQLMWNVERDGASFCEFMERHYGP